MTFYLRLALAALAASIISTAAHADGKPRQLVIVSFDGAGDNRLWQRSRDMARRNNASFTYFLSCALVMDPATAKTYQAPGKRAGRSNVGFGQSTDEVITRLNHIWKAREEGNEIASHACGHFDGKEWTANDWETEFRIFDRTMRSAWKNAGIGDQEPQGWQDFVTSGISGFRAPYLSTGPELTAAEKKHGFVYDGSTVARGVEMPGRKGGVLHFGLPLIPEGPKARRIIAMDYNLFIRHSAGVETPSKAGEFGERTYAAFRAAFDEQYNGRRIPLQLGFHFVLMNGGAYWNALERLVDEVCTMDDVSCVSYAEAMRLLDAPDRQAENRQSGL